MTIVKTKSAVLHNEHIIGLLSSCDSSVGNLGHGRNQVDAMLKAFQAYLHKKTTKIMTTPVPLTGLPRHFCTASDKSPPHRVSNHAIMVLLIPIAVPPVYEFAEFQVSGGTACHLAGQIIASLMTNLKLPQSHLSYLMAHQADGQYQTQEFTVTLKDSVCIGDQKPVNQDDFFVVPWDTVHWLDCCLEGIRLKEDDGELLRGLIKRVNKFHHMFGHGCGHCEYTGFAKENEISSFSRSNFSTTRFASRSFKTFEKLTLLPRLRAHPI